METLKETTNEERAAHGEFALMGYVDSFGQQTLGDLDTDEVEEQLKDMIVDSLHFAIQQGFDVIEILNSVRNHILHEWTEKP